MEYNEAKQKVIPEEMPNLQWNIMDKLKEFEGEYEKWRTKDVIAWIKIIANRKFNDNKYNNTIQKIMKLEINGEGLKDLQNESLLKLLGLNALDRNVLQQNVDRVVYGKGGKIKDMCTICTSNRINAMFIPCGHMAVCYGCYTKSKGNFRTCPICRKHVTNTKKAFMAGF